MTEQLEILGQRMQSVRRGYGGDFCVQLTHVRLGEVEAFVRENRRATSDEHFLLSANARLGHKADGNRIGREVLELAAPAHAWERIAAKVRGMDHLRRPVMRHAHWTMRTATTVYERAWEDTGWPQRRAGGQR